MKKDFYFPSHGVRCAAWHIPAESDALAGSAGRPSVVMGHGFGGTRDSGLLDYAESFAAAGIDALVFDYRGFGDSEGTPRQDVSVRRQRQDYHAAIAVARHLPGVDPDRIALWGYSYGGGHVIAVAAQDPRVAAIVSMNPAADGLATLARIVRSPHHVPVVGQPGSTAMITAPGAEEGYYAMAGPTAQNEVCARHALQVARTVPQRSPTAWPARCPIDHLDVFQSPWQQQALTDQLEFLTRVLDPSRSGDVHLRAQVEPLRTHHSVLKFPWLAS